MRYHNAGINLEGRNASSYTRAQTWRLADVRAGLIHKGASYLPTYLPTYLTTLMRTETGYGSL